MTDQIKEWLRQKSPALSERTLQRAPNLLPDENAVSVFLTLLMITVDERAYIQLAAIQSWAQTHIGADAAMAQDWLILLRLLKETISQSLTEDFTAEVAWQNWRLIDPIFNDALIETTRLAQETDRATYLELMNDLRQQMDRLNRSKSNFIAIAAHELKTPLTILEGYADMMRDALPSGYARLLSYVDGFNNGTRRLRTIIEDMLDATMLEAQSLPINWQPVYLHTVLDSVVKRLSPYFAERSVNLVMDSMAMQGTMYADPHRLSQVFEKVVENALKYTPDGGDVKITTVLTRLEEATNDIKGYIDIQVHDTGIGIDKADLKTIFEKFATNQNVALHSSGKTKFKGGGPGLGLPIARGIVEAHGGLIWAESECKDEEKCPGTIFHVELPLYVKQPSDE